MTGIIYEHKKEKWRFIAKEQVEGSVGRNYWEGRVLFAKLI